MTELEAMMGFEELTLDQYQAGACDFAFYTGHTVYPALGLAGEAGEVADKVKKLMRDDLVDFSADDAILQMPADKARAIALELGDVLWYIANLANDIGYSLEEIAEMNLEKLRDRDDRQVLSGSGDNR